MTTWLLDHYQTLLVLGALSLLALFAFSVHRYSKLEAMLEPDKNSRSFDYKANIVNNLIEAIQDNRKKELFAYSLFAAAPAPLLWAVVTNKGGKVSISVEMTRNMPQRFHGIYESHAWEIIGLLTKRKFSATFTANAELPAEELFV